MAWQPWKTAPKEHGALVLAWFAKHKLDEDDESTDEVVGGAAAQIERQGDGWTEPEWLGSHGSYFFEDWAFAEEPVLWHPMPPDPIEAELEVAFGVKGTPSDGVLGAGCWPRVTEGCNSQLHSNRNAPK